MRLQIEKGRWLHTATVPHQIFENVLLFLYFVLFERLGMYLFTKIETKRLFKGRIVQILGLFDIVSSDLCLILSNLRAVQSVSQSIKKSTKCSKQGGGVKGVLNNVKKTAELVKRDIPKESMDNILSIHPGQILQLDK